MKEKDKQEGMLSPYRVLDLTDEKGYAAGKMIGDLGADVIKIEPPGGDPGRNLGPFYHDEPHPEKSLFWWAFNNNKRSITLNLETIEGKEIFRKLVKTADIVIESFGPGYMDKQGLGYSELEKVNPGIIFVSITPFGKTGPWRDFKNPDVVAWALGGQAYDWGDRDRAPVRISYHSHAHLHAGCEAAVGALIALYHREVFGTGQEIDVTIHEATAQAARHITLSWDRMKRNRQRGGGVMGVQLNTALTLKEVWPCKDGEVNWRFSSGVNARRYQEPFVEWLDGEGMAGYLKQVNWDTLDLSTTTQDEIDRIEAPAAKFFLKHTKAELYAGALQRGLELYPVGSAKDTLENAQLKARDFWVKLEHPELGASITYPGAFAISSEAQIKIRRRPPLIGEHNQEIYEGELKIPKEELVILKQTKVI